MNQTESPYHGYRFPPEIISYAADFVRGLLIRLGQLSQCRIK